MDVAWLAAPPHLEPGRRGRRGSTRPIQRPRSEADWKRAEAAIGSLSSKRLLEDEYTEAIFALESFATELEPEEPTDEAMAKLARDQLREQLGLVRSAVKHGDEVLATFTVAGSCVYVTGGLAYSTYEQAPDPLFAAIQALTNFRVLHAAGFEAEL